MSDAEGVRDRPKATGIRQAEPGEGQRAAGQEIRTFLIADIRGYTTFTEERGDEAAARLATTFADIVREFVDARSGSLIEIRGDEALAAFTSPRQAIKAAVDLQARFLQESTDDPSMPLAVGIGLDAGEAAVVADGYRGGALNLAARLCNQADAGEVLASHSVVHLAGSIDGISYDDRGPSRLKGLSEPVQVLAISADELDVASRMRAVAPVKRLSASRGRLDFLVLGPLEVDGPSGPFALGGPKQRTVLAHLLLRANEVISTESLIDDLWGEEPPENARNIIQIHVSRLRKVLGSDRIEGVAPGYRVRVDPSELDATRFESLLRDAVKAMPIDPAVALGTLDDALTLWRGAAFADMVDQPALRAEASRLDELRVEAQEERISGSLATGAASRAVADAESLLARHPWREAVWAQLMLGLYREGRQAEALAAFQRAREILAAELGVDPSPELQRLHERILRHDEDLELRGEALRGYRLLEQIGEGPNGVVYRAIQPNVHRDVAVKVIHERIATDPAFVERFELASQRAASLEHPHIVPVYDYWREPGRAYLVTRYLRGGSLRAREERGETFDREHGLRVLEQVASALAFAHARGTSHGHVTNSNTLFDADGNAFLCDFAVSVDPAADLAADVSEVAAVMRRSVLREPPSVVEDALARAELGIDGPTAAELADAARAALAPVTSSAVSKAEDVRNPYKGLRAFTEADAPDFFGRNAIVQRLVNQLREDDAGGGFLAVVGPSGSGKSSLVRAGLVAAIRAGGLGSDRATLVAEMFPGGHPLEELEAALLRIAVRPPGPLQERLRGGSRGLLDVVDLIAPSDTDVVLVIDQLEEVFTLTTAEREREMFLEAIRVASVDPASRLRVIVTLRADFYDRPLAFPRLGELLADRTVAIPPLTPDELELAIRGPADGVGLPVEPGLVVEMIADVAPQPGALPLLQYALTELFEARGDEGLTTDAYRRIGGVAGALSTRADQLYEAADADGRRTIRQVFLRLVTLGEGREDTRRRVTRTELDRLEVQTDAIDTVLAAYGAHRILTFDREPTTREPTVEIAHEALLGAWGRLRSWIDGAREDLRHDRSLALASAEWRASDGDSSFLMRGARLDQLEAWADATDLAIGVDERAYVKASVDQRARERAADRERQEHQSRLERRSRARLRALVAVLTVAALIAGTLTLIATDQSRRAARAADQAAMQARIAGARELAAAAIGNLDQDPERSILLAIEAVERAESMEGPVLLEAEESLHQAINASRVVMTTMGVGGALAWSRGGVFVTEGPNGSGMIDIRDVESGGHAVPPFQGHDGDISDVAFSLDGSKLATTGDDGLLKVWDPSSRRVITSFSGPGDPRNISFDDDGALVAAVWGEQTVRVIDVSTGDVVLKLSLGRSSALREGGPMTDPEGYPMIDAALSHDGRTLAAADGGVDGHGGVTLVDVRTGSRSISLDATGVHALAWSPDDRSIATVGSSGVGEVWDTSTGDVRNQLKGQRSFLWAVAWSPKGDRIATGGAEGAVQVWEIGTGAARETLTLRSLELRDGIGFGGVAFSPNGRHVMAGAADPPVVKVWDVSQTGDAELANLPAPSTFGDAALLPDGDHAIVSSGWGSATIWGIDVGHGSRTIGLRASDDERPEPALSLSPDGSEIAIVSDAPDDPGDQSVGTIAVYDTGSGEPLFTTKRSGPVDPAWSADGQLLAISGGRTAVRILDRSGREVAAIPVEGDERRAVAAAFSPDDRYLALSVKLDRSDARPGLLQIWDWRQGLVVREIEARHGEVAFDPSGELVVVFDGEVAETFGLRSQTRVARADLHTDANGDIAISPDASMFASSLPGGTIQLLDVGTGRVLMRLPGHAAGVASLAFRSDGEQLISVGHRLVGDYVRVWALDIDDLISIARRNVFRELTDEECQQYLHVARCAA